jgi:hypothetical protein
MRVIDYKTIADDVLDGESAQQAFDRLSVKGKTVSQDIDSSDIKRYLMLIDKWLPIEDAANQVIDPPESARVAVTALNTFDIFQLTDESTGDLVKAKLSAIMDQLILDDLISSDDKTVIMAMGQTFIYDRPWLKIGHVVNAMEWYGGDS